MYYNLYYGKSGKINATIFDIYKLIIHIKYYLKQYLCMWYSYYAHNIYK